METHKTEAIEKQNRAKLGQNLLDCPELRELLDHLAEELAREYIRMETETFRNSNERKLESESTSDWRE